MSDLRFDPVSGLWALIAHHRSDRPIELVPVEQISKSALCPFCGGNESETPKALAIYTDPQQPPVSPDKVAEAAWVSRVVPNKYSSFAPVSPATAAAVEDQLQVQKQSRGETDPLEGDGPFASLSLPGLQELLIPTPRHVQSLSELDDNETRMLWQATHDRLLKMRDGGVAKHGMLFMNCRSQAGASLEHIHLQLVGSPVVSDYMAGRVKRNRESLDSKNQTLVESILKWEVAQKSRVVHATENFTVLCPFASRFAYQVWIVPNDPNLSFLDSTVALREELGNHCRDIVRRLEHQLGKPSYNMLLQIAPFRDMADDHWYIEILPRTTRSAGFEIGTDVWVNPTPPELAAETLRTAQLGVSS